MCAKSGFNQKHKRPSHLIFHTKRAYFVCIQRTKNVPDGTFCSLPPPHLKSKSTRVINNTRQLISPHYLSSHPCRSTVPTIHPNFHLDNIIPYILFHIYLVLYQYIIRCGIPHLGVDWSIWLIASIHFSVQNAYYTIPPKSINTCHRYLKQANKQAG